MIAQAQKAAPRAHPDAEMDWEEDDMEAPADSPARHAVGPNHVVPACLDEDTPGRADADGGGDTAHCSAGASGATPPARARRRGPTARAAPRHRPAGADARGLQLRRSLGSHFELGVAPCAAPTQRALAGGRAVPPWERHAPRSTR